MMSVSLVRVHRRSHLWSTRSRVLYTHRRSRLPDRRPLQLETRRSSLHRYKMRPNRRRTLRFTTEGVTSYLWDMKRVHPPDQLRTGGKGKCGSLSFCVIPTPTGTLQMFSLSYRPFCFRASIVRIFSQARPKSYFSAK